MKSNRSMVVTSIPGNQARAEPRFSSSVNHASTTLQTCPRFAFKQSDVRSLLGAVTLAAEKAEVNHIS